MQSIPHKQPSLLATLGALALCATAIHAGTVSTTFSFQQGDLQKDGASYGSGNSYSGAVSGHITDGTATFALTTAATATTGNQFRSGTNGQNFVGLFSYDLTELSDFITSNTGPNSSVTVTAVNFKLISTGGSATVSGTQIRLYQTDPFGSATWSTTDGSTAWSAPFQNIGSTAQYGYTGGGSALGSNLGGTSPTVTSTTVTAGANLQWTSSAGFISAINSALASGDKKLYLTTNCSLGNADSRVVFNTGTATTVDNRPELLITLDVTTTAASATWTGATGNSWTTATNWSPNGVPATDAPIIFNSSSTSNLSTVLNQDFTVASVAVSNPTGPVSISGPNILNLGAGGFDLSAAAQNLTVSAPVVLGATQNWNVASGRTLSLNGGLSGSSSLTIAGAGKVSLGAAATHSTTTNISTGGTLQTGASNVLPNGAGVGNLMNDGTLDLNGFSQSINGLSGGGTIDNTAAGACVLTVGNNNSFSNYTGVIQDTGGDLGLVKVGSSNINLLGSNSFAGGFTNNGTGNIAPQNSNAFGTGPVVINNAVTVYPTNNSYTFANTLTLNGATLRQGGGNSRLLTWSGPVSIPSNSTIQSDGSTAGVTISGPITLDSGAILSSLAGGTAHTLSGGVSGNGGLTVTSGTLILSGASSYSGSTTMNAGTLRLEAAGTIPASSNLTINGAGNFNVRNTSGWVYNGTISGDGTGQINLNTGTNASLAGPISGVAGITANNTGTDATISSNIIGSNTVTVTGGAILTLSGNNSSMSGNVTLSGATAGTQINIKSATAIGTGSLAINGGNNGKIDNTSGSALTLSTNNAQAWDSNFTFVGTDALNLGTGAVTMGGNRTISVTTSTLTVGGIIGDGGSAYGLTKSGWGTLALTGTNTYTGDTAIITGKLDINSIQNYGVNSAIGAPASGAIQLGSGNGNFATLSYSGAGGSTNRTVQIGDTTATNESAGAIQNNGTGALIFSATNLNPTISGIAATRTLWLGGSYTGGANEIQGIIQDNDAAGKVNVGKGNDASTWVLSGANTYTGSTNVQGGTLKLGATGSIATSTAVNISAGGTLDTTAHATHTIPATQTVAFGIDAAGSGSSGKIAAAGLNVSNAVVTYTIAGTPDDPVYILATYTAGQLTGTFASVDAPPAGYTLNYAYEGNKIALVQAAGSAYQNWAGGALFNGDANGDGVQNGLAWILGAADKDVSALNKLPTVGTPAGFLTLSFNRVNPYTPAKLYIEYSNNLSSWTKLEIPAGSGTIPSSDVEVVVTPGSPDAVTVKIPTTHASGGKLFGRLSATEN